MMRFRLAIALAFLAVSNQAEVARAKESCPDLSGQFQMKLVDRMDCSGDPTLITLPVPLYQTAEDRSNVADLSRAWKTVRDQDFLSITQDACNKLTFQFQDGDQYSIDLTDIGSWERVESISREGDVSYVKDKISLKSDRLGYQRKNRSWDVFGMAVPVPLPLFAWTFRESSQWTFRRDGGDLLIKKVSSQPQISIVVPSRDRSVCTFRFRQVSP